MTKRVFISGAGLLGPTGASVETAFHSLLEGVTGLHFHVPYGLPAGFLHADAVSRINTLKEHIDQGRRLDKTALLAVAAAQDAVRQAILPNTSAAGVIIGSSRGATESFESYHKEFVLTQKSSPSMSPVTTAVTLPAAVATALGCRGPVFSVSSACQTGLTALGTAYHFIRSGIVNAYIAGAAEACVTPFTLGSLDALHLLSHERGNYPLQSCEPGRNGTVLSEGSGVFVLEAEEALQGREPLAELLDFAQSNETTTLTGVTDNAEGLQRCIREILMKNEIPDLVIGHFPGTVNGDRAEMNAIDALLPDIAVTTFKWSTGHMLGASPCFAVSMALQIMKHGVVPELPYATASNLLLQNGKVETGMPVRRILLTAMGFGGNSAAILIQK